jgi:DNA repair exonuclease SbcCD ATPase subunit
MSDNQANPTKGAETDLQKAAKSISGLLTPLNPKEEEEIGKSEAPQEQTEEQNSPEPKQEESSTEDQPLEQEIKEEESQEETSEEVSQEQTNEIPQEQDSTYKVKVAGQELDVTLDELKNGYSRDADYRRKTEELSYEKKQFMSESEKQRQDYSSKLNELNQLMSVAQEQLNAEINSADLDKLYDEDPTEAARVERRLKRKQDKLNQAVQKTQSEQQQQFESFLQDQQKKLTLKMPEFSDPAKSSQLKNNMRSYLTSYGFNDQEIAQVYDHRIVMLVNDAMKYRNMQNSKPNLAKKITKPGKVFSSGVKKDKADLNLTKRREKLGRLKKTGSIKDATSIFLDMVNNKQQ